MDRVIVYPGSIPQDVDILNTNKNAEIALAFLTSSIFGNSTIAAGLSCAPASGSLGVVISPGSLSQVMPVDATAYGSLASDTTDTIVKTGINISATNLSLSAPLEAGYSVNYLIQAQISETDGSPLTLAYYDASNPTIPYSGPLNSGAANNTVRQCRVQLQTAATVVAAPTGTQTTPSPDSGFVGLWVVTVSYGQTTISSGNISQYVLAPFSPYQLQNLTPGFSHQRVFSSSTTWQAPLNANRIRLTMWAGGGAGGGGGGAGYVGGGGAGGEYLSAIFTVTPGAIYTVTVGAGGGGGTGNGGAGGNTVFGSLATATGGAGGGAGSSGSVGIGGSYGGTSGISSAVQGDPIALPGVGGGNGLTFGTAGVLISGTGGGSGYSGTGAPITASASTGNSNGQSITTPGCGGSGGIGTGTGGAGAPGLVVVAW